MRIERLMRLHRLYAPAGEDGSDTGGTDVVDEQDSGDVETTESDDGDTTDEDAEPADDEVVVTLGDEPAPEDDDKRAPDWVRELRKSNREKDRRIRELEQKVSVVQPASAAPVVIGPKPTLEGCDYDSDKFSSDLESWHERKRKVDEAATKQRQEEENARATWQTKLDAYGKAKTALKVKDYDDAESVVQDVFSITQQGILLDGADNPAILTYALGKNPKKAKELASLTNPVKFAFAVAKLETQLKVQPRKTAPVPERSIRSTVAGTSAVDNQLDRLRAESEKTGDLSKVVAYKSAQKAKQRA